MDFVISDTHFGHNNIIKYCNRPFKNANEMDKALIENWNSIVGPGDHVYHVGDFGLAKLDYLKHIRSQLNGKITLIKGNHDRGLLGMRNVGVDFFYNKDLLVFFEDVSVYFSHEPNFKRKGTVHLYGHVHDKTPQDQPYWAHNVSVEVVGYKPVPLIKYYEYLL